MNTITKEMLVEVEACTEQVKLFTEIFPNGAKVNKPNALKAIKAELSIGWAIVNLLSKSKYDDYKAKLKPLVDDYLAKLKPLGEGYYAKRKPLWEDYCAKIKPIEDDYYVKIKLIWGDFRAKKALLFVEIYNS